jgi:hypothetical protein
VVGVRMAGQTLAPVVVLAFTLLLRLPNGYGPKLSGEEEWLDWRDASPVVPQSVYGDPTDEPPSKRYPGSREYFAPHVQETLFPTRGTRANSGRWVRRPEGWSVALGSGVEVEHELSVDLLEMVRVRLTPQVTFGIAHLTLSGEATSQDMLVCARMLATRYRPSRADSPLLGLAVGSRVTAIHGPWDRPAEPAAEPAAPPNHGPQHAPKVAWKTYQRVRMEARRTHPNNPADTGAEAIKLALTGKAFSWKDTEGHRGSTEVHRE